jgi:GntR family transcriptional regulator, transcriptional repressor for pyruvate dehydrogenase complex
MALRPVHRRSVPDEVFDQLLDGIVTGAFEPGAELPSERRLAEELGVSRPTVREALQRLAHAKLIEVRQGGTTTVRDYRRSAGLDLLPQLLAGAGEPDLEVVRSLLEVRADVAPNVARRCAQRRDEAVLARLDQLVARMAAEQGQPASLQRTAHDLWDAMVDGTDNLVDRLLFNALAAVYLPTLDLLVEVMAEEVGDLDGYRELVAAIREQDAATAAAAAERIVGRGTAHAMRLLQRLA